MEEWGKLKGGSAGVSLQHQKWMSYEGRMGGSKEQRGGRGKESGQFILHS